VNTAGSNDLFRVFEGGLLMEVSILEAAIMDQIIELCSMKEPLLRGEAVE